MVNLDRVTYPESVTKRCVKQVVNLDRVTYPESVTKGGVKLGG